MANINDIIVVINARNWIPVNNKSAVNIRNINEIKASVPPTLTMFLSIKRQRWRHRLINPI